MARTRLQAGALVVCLAAALPGPVAAAGLDPHALYEQHCARCHAGHASELADASLRLVDDQAVETNSGRPIERLLSSHFGQPLSTDQITALVDHFAAILSTGRLYRQKCIICHDPAVTLARHQLIERDGVLLGRYDGRDIETFLAGHGRLTEPEVATITTMLRRQLATAATRTTP